MSIKKKLPLIFTTLVICILIANSTIHYIRSKHALLEYNEREIALITQEFLIGSGKCKGWLVICRNMIAKELRTAALAIKKSLPPNHEDVTNEQLRTLAEELMISHITLLAQTEDDIVGVKSSDPHELNMSTKEWEYWYDAFQQLFALTRC